MLRFKMFTIAGKLAPIPISPYLSLAEIMTHCYNQQIKWIDEPMIEMTGSFCLTTEVPRADSFRNRAAFCHREAVPTCPSASPRLRCVCFSLLSLMKRINMMGVVFPSHFLSFQETLRQDEQCHPPALCYKQVSPLWAQLKLSSKCRGSPVRRTEDPANSLGNALVICRSKT